MFQQNDRRRQPEPLGRSGNVALAPRSAGASFGPDIPTCGRKENLIVPRSADPGKGLRQARRRGRTPRTRSSGILASAGSACCYQGCWCEYSWTPARLRTNSEAARRRSKPERRSTGPNQSYESLADRQTGCPAKLSNWRNVPREAARYRSEMMR
jgi:hypothetical protein